MQGEEISGLLSPEATASACKDCTVRSELEVGGVSTRQRNCKRVVWICDAVTDAAASSSTAAARGLSASRCSPLGYAEDPTRCRLSSFAAAKPEPGERRKSPDSSRRGLSSIGAVPLLLPEHIGGA